MLQKTESLPGSSSASASRRLTTFRPPTPSRAMITVLNPINRWVMLGGVPGLRRLPLLGQVPGLRGLMNVPEIDFPEAERKRLRNAVNSTTAAFITPNHPEFFTDWMLDKYVLSQAAPMAACWATHTIVNGLGSTMQRFWLKNNLIAQIPGAGGQAGKDYSVSWARKGKGVLLHPEGSVGWHGDVVAPLFTGAADMAQEAALQIQDDGEQRPVFIVPVVWKLFFVQDVTRTLHREMKYIERCLQLPKGSTNQDAGLRLYAIYDALLARDEVAWNIHPTAVPFRYRHQKLMQKLLVILSDKLDQLGAPPLQGGDVSEAVRRAGRWLRGQSGTTLDMDHVKRLKKTLERVDRFKPEIYPDRTLSQEHIAECLKRLRNDYCGEGLRNTFHNYVPQPVGPRRAVIRVPEPLRVDPEDISSADLTEALRRRMQSCLTKLIKSEAERQSAFPTYANPFLVA